MSPGHPLSAAKRALGVVFGARRRRVIVAFGLAALLASTTAIAQGNRPAQQPDVPLRILSGWVPYWNGDRSPSGIVAMGPLSSSISPFAYEVLDADRVERRGSPDVNARMRQASVGARLPLIPTMFDATDDQLMVRTLTDPARRALHVNTLVNVVLDGGYDGLDLDYESFAFEDGYSSWENTRPLWVQFVMELSAALHSYAKLLYVTIPPTYDNNREKTSGYWVYDPVAIAPYADRIRIMAYDYSWSTPGPGAPLNWTQIIVDWVAANMPASKVELGVPLYGRDWITGVSGQCPAGVRTSGRSGLRTERAIARAIEKGVTPVRAADGEMRFSYTETYTGPSGPTAPPDSATDEPDGLEPIISVPIEGITFNEVPNPAGRSAMPMRVAQEGDVEWPFPVDNGGGGGDTGGGGGGDNPPVTNPPITNPPVTNPPTVTVTCTVTRTVFYPDAGTTVAKAEQALAKGLGGIVFFAVGYEEAGHFMAAREVAARVPHAPGVDPIGEIEIEPGEPGRVRVSGWALDPEANIPIIVRITVDGELRKQVLANGEVPTLATLYPGNGPFHGVDTLVAASEGPHRVCVQAIGLGAGTTLRWLRCKTVDVTPTP